MSALAKFLYYVEIDYLLYLNLVLIVSITIRNMYNFKDLFNWNKKKKNIKNDNDEFEEVCEFYNMLVKYRNFHPLFKIKYVILKVYPNLNWKEFISKMKL